MADGYGAGLFDSKGPEAFAAAIKQISSALSGVGSGFTDFATKAESSISSISTAIDALINKLQGLNTSVGNLSAAAGGVGGGGNGAGGGGWTAPPPSSGGSGGTGDVTQGGWTMGDASTPNSHTGDSGTNMMPAGTTDSSKPSWMDRFFHKHQTGTASGGPTSQTGTTWQQRAAQSLPSAAAGAASNLIQGAGQSLISNAVQGATIGQMLAPAFGVSAKSLYVTPSNMLTQNAGDYAQANYYAVTQMGVAPGTANWSTVQQSANQAMTLSGGSMTRSQSMVAYNQMQQANVLNTAVGFGVNLRPGGTDLKLTDQFNLIFNRIFMGAAPTGKEFESAMQPGANGYVNLSAFGIQPGSDDWNLFMQYALTRISKGATAAGNVGTAKGAKAAGLDTPGYSQLQATSKKSQLQSAAEPGIAGATKSVNDFMARGLGDIQSGLGGLGDIMHLPGVSDALSSLNPLKALSLPGGGDFLKNLNPLSGVGGKLGGIGHAAKGLFGGIGHLVGGLGHEAGSVVGGLTHAATSVIGGGVDTVMSMLAGKLTDIPNTALSALLSPAPTGSVLASVSTKSTAGASTGGGGAPAPKQATLTVAKQTAKSAPKQSPQPVGGSGGGQKKGGGGGILGDIGGFFSSLGKDYTQAFSSPNTAVNVPGTQGTGGAPSAATTAAVTAAALAQSTNTTPGAFGWTYTDATSTPMDMIAALSAAPTSLTKKTSSTTTTTSGAGSGAGSGSGSGSSGTGSSGTAPTGTLAGWIATAMKLTGVSGSDWTNGLNTIIQHESSGNPNAVNNWDSNAKAGHPSQGLMQEIPSTFQANALPGYNTNILDPVSNIAAGIKYIESKYQTIDNVPGIKGLAAGTGYVGYARGSQLIDRTQLATLHRGEAVVTAADNYSTTPYNRNGAMGGGSPIVHLNFKSGAITIQVPAGSTQQDMDNIAQQFVTSLSKPTVLSSVRSK